MGLTFDDYLTADWTKTWDTPVDLRYMFDALAPWPGLCWVLRGDPEHLRPQLSGIPAFDWQEQTPIEVRLVETPDIDVFTFALVLAELNKRNRLDARLEEIHLCWYQRLVEQLPAATVSYVGSA
ncbi:hypothetical protein [Pseudomonas sp. PP3]|uniref:hypothetical protein n=1 Tax=Pseudomonas sp. PP3 TaxID=2815936 RepID=UPI001BAFD48B|nr:hypothetical protein [Pseudomonas sp. PP3]